MKFDVRWTHSARNQLAKLWIEADSAFRKRITEASSRIDQELVDDPESKGESREDRERILFVFPLAVQFEIIPMTNRVRVLRLWIYRRSK